jgi:hypothetical protein
MMHEYITPDKNKTKSLKKMAEELFERVRKFPLQDYPSPNLSDLYDVIHMLLDAIFIMEGIKFKGDGAHIELIDEAKKEEYLTDQEHSLIQQIRGIRNRYKYEGYSVKGEFITRNEKKIISIIENLREKIDNKS